MANVSGFVLHHDQPPAGAQRVGESLDRLAYGQRVKVEQQVIADDQVKGMLDVRPEPRVVDIGAAESDHLAQSWLNDVMPLAAMHFAFDEVAMAQVCVNQPQSRLRVA